MANSDKSSSQNTQTYVIGGVIGLVIGALATLGIMKLAGDGADPVVAKVQGDSIRASEAFSSIKTRLFDLEDEIFRLKERAILDVVEHRLLEKEAKEKNMPVEQLLEQAAGGAAPEATDAEVDEFLKSKGLSLSDPRIKKADVKEYLKFKNQHEKRQTYVSQLKEKANVKVLVKGPESPRITVATEGYPSWGNATAPVSIVIFSDFQCPFCARAVETVNQIKQNYGPEKVRIVFRDMPLPSHPQAEPAAHASLCAMDQGKFWEMHDTLFLNQRALEENKLKDYAKQVGLDLAKWEDCFKKKPHQSLIEQSKREAQAVGISATPSFVINGQLIQGAQPIERFKEKIDKELRG